MDGGAVCIAVGAQSVALGTQGFDACLRPQLSGLRVHARQLTGNRSDADDLLQETLLRAWRYWGSYRAGSNLRGWLHRILLNTFRSRYRRAARERELLARAQREDVLGAASVQPVFDDGLSEDVERALASMPASFQAVLCAVAIDELSYGETAAQLGCPVGTVMSRLHRARAAFVATLA